MRMNGRQIIFEAMRSIQGQAFHPGSSLPAVIGYVDEMDALYGENLSPSLVIEQLHQLEVWSRQLQLAIAEIKGREDSKQ